MTYLVIRPGAAMAEVLDGVPSWGQIKEVLGGGAIGLARASEMHGAAAWIDDDFAGRDLERNVLATIVAVYIGASRTPYAGPMVLTGFEMSPLDGIVPAEMDPAIAMSIEQFLHDTGSALGLHDEPAEKMISLETFSSLHEVAAYARFAPFPQPEVFVIGSAEDFLAAAEQAEARGGQVPTARPAPDDDSDRPF